MQTYFQALKNRRLPQPYLCYTHSYHIRTQRTYNIIKFSLLLSPKKREAHNMKIWIFPLHNFELCFSYIRLFSLARNIIDSSSLTFSPASRWRRNNLMLCGEGRRPLCAGLILQRVADIHFILFCHPHWVACIVML